jgi:hypothetical protein
MMMGQLMSVGSQEFLQKLADELNNEVLKPLKKIDEKVVHIVATGQSGSGKSYALNVLLVTKSLLAKENLEEVHYGGCPLPSQSGQDDVTQLPIKLSFSKEWAVRPLFLEKVGDEKYVPNEIDTNLLDLYSCEKAPKVSSPGWPNNFRSLPTLQQIT